MKIDILAINEFIQEHVSVKHLICSDADQKYDFPVLYTPEIQQTNPGSLYVAASNSLPRSLALFSGCGLICIGDHPLYHCNECNVIVIPEHASVASVYALISGLFWQYSEWEKAFLKKVADGSDLQELIDFSSLLFDGNSLSCTAGNRLVAGKLYTHLLSSDPANPLYSDDELPVQAILDNLSISDMPGSKNEIINYVANTPSRDFHLLCRRLYIKNKYFGFLALSDLDHPFTHTDRLAFTLLGDVIEIAINEGCTVTSEPVKTFRNLLQSILDGTPQPREYIQAQLDKIEIEKNPTFICAALRLNPNSLQHLIISSIRSKIGLLLNNAYVTTHDNDAVFFVHVTDAQSVRTIIEKIEALIGNDSYKIGVSNTFRDIENVPQYYIQASEAISLGNLYRNDQVIHYYSDYALDYIMEQTITKLPAQFVIHSGIQALFQSDEQQSTDYINTLHTYFKNSQNAVRTAEDLFIHRSTLLYRLEQIKKIMGCGWDNYQDRLYMMFSLELINWIDHRRS